MTLTYFVRYKTDLRVIIQAIYTHKHNAENETKRKKTQLFKVCTDTPIRTAVQPPLTLATPTCRKKGWPKNRPPKLLNSLEYIALRPLRLTAQLNHGVNSTQQRIKDAGV